MPWDIAENWQRDSAIAGVNFVIANPDAPVSAQHEAWCEDKTADGWTFGTAKNAVNKEHPCLVPYVDLPVEQRLKDYLFRAVVSAFVQAAHEAPNV